MPHTSEALDRQRKQKQVGTTASSAEDQKRKRLEYQREYVKNNPWIKSCYLAKQRCNNAKNHSYYKYGSRGIKFKMTLEEFKFLWFRDKAYEMKKPTIDRIDSKGNYELSNCRYLEHYENSTRNLNPVKIAQISKKGKVVKIWDSISSTIKALNLNEGNLYRCLNNEIPSTSGFVWRRIGSLTS